MIPSDHPKSNVLASDAGTPQAREAIIASGIPQTATPVIRINAFTGFAFGYAAGVAHDCWCHPYWGGYGHVAGYGYTHVYVNSTNLYTHWGTAVHATGSSGYNAYTGREWAGHSATAFNPYSGARAAGQGGAAVNRGVVGNAKTGNAVGWNNGNVYADHQGNVHQGNVYQVNASGNYDSLHSDGWHGQSADAQSWASRSWGQSSAGNFDRSADSLDSQRFGQAFGSQRFDSVRSGGGGGFRGRGGFRR